MITEAMRAALARAAERAHTLIEQEGLPVDFDLSQLPWPCFASDRARLGIKNKNEVYRLRSGRKKSL